MARRRLNVFSLSFLDCMSCGFGAVILFFMIINVGTTRDTRERTETRRAEVERLEQEIVEGRRHLVVLRNSVEQISSQQSEDEERAEKLIELVRAKAIELAEFESDTTAQAEDIAALQADLESLEEQAKRLEGASHGKDRRGDALRTVEGKGDRQYLTGLRMGGERILILVDTSASMLAETVVNAVRRRHLPVEKQRQSPKWRRALATLDWLTARMPPESKFQIYTFNTEAKPLIQGSEGKWLEASAVETLDKALERLQQVVPEGGTSLHKAFAALKAMDPLPDNVFLVTDGLPTQGASAPWLSTVSAKRRRSHFTKAVKELPDDVPVNTILFPMEGDPDAAFGFWMLAQQTDGSLLSPSRDWP